MAEFFGNPWVIGIGGGILSGIIVTFVSRALFSRRDNREYTQKLLSANHEVLYAIRPGVSEGLVPSQAVIEALVAATARKYGVDVTDLYTPKQIAQELMKEVMDSSFISAKSKEQYCDQLSPLITPPPVVAPSSAIRVEARRSTGVEEYRRRMVTLFSAMMGLLTAMMTLVYALSRDGLFSSLGHTDSIFGGTFVPLLLALLTTVMATLAMEVLRRRPRRSDRDTSDLGAENDDHRGDDASQQRHRADGEK